MGSPNFKLVAGLKFVRLIVAEQRIERRLII
jgi:hypothetical protein